MDGERNILTSMRLKGRYAIFVAYSVGVIESHLVRAWRVAAIVYSTIIKYGVPFLNCVMNNITSHTKVIVAVRNPISFIVLSVGLWMVRSSIVTHRNE